MAPLYRNCAVIGISISEFKRLSMWEFAALVNGYNEAHSDKGATLSEAEAQALFDWIDEGSPAPRALTTMTYRWDGRGAVPAGVVSFTI